MSRKDIVITTMLIVTISAFFIGTGIVSLHDYHIDDETGIKYYIDKEINFLHYYDSDYDLDIGYYLNNEDVLFFREDPDDRWQLLETNMQENEIETNKNNEGRLLDLIPLESGLKYQDSSKETYYYVENLDFVYYYDKSSNRYFGYFQENEKELYFYNNNQWKKYQ